MAQVCLIPQYTSSLQALHRAQTSDLYGFILIELHKPKPRRRHRAAHRGADHSEPCEIGGVVEILRSQHVSDEDVVEKARMTSPALASRSRFLLRERVSTPSVAL